MNLKTIQKYNILKLDIIFLFSASWLFNCNIIIINRNKTRIAPMYINNITKLKNSTFNKNNIKHEPIITQTKPMIAYKHRN